MTAAEQASEVALAIRNDVIIKNMQRREPVVVEIPIGPEGKSFGLVVNFYIGPEFLSLSTLWILTVPLIRQLFLTSRLDIFKVIEVRVMTLLNENSPERVITLRSSVKDIDEIPAREEEDLARDIWDGERFDCYWYRDKNSISA
ncbi:MAG: hypothetical protein M3O30_06790 [Planctomycetota bacterium]|nr:hypothetical protein [Planctomycetota bacterium]